MVLSSDGSFGVKGKLEDVILHTDGITTFMAGPLSGKQATGTDRKLYIESSNQPTLVNGRYIEATALPSGTDSSGEEVAKITHLLVYGPDSETLEHVYVDAPSGIVRDLIKKVPLFRL